MRPVVAVIAGLQAKAAGFDTLYRSGAALTASAGERIRDKIAASKKKGIWMGGAVPLGYAVEQRKLVIVEAEASLVRHIFARYVTLGSRR